jgi:hypothetical protein
VKAGSSSMEYAHDVEVETRRAEDASAAYEEAVLLVVVVVVMVVERSSIEDVSMAGLEDVELLEGLGLT